jgi:hypothetical protein
MSFAGFEARPIAGGNDCSIGVLVSRVGSVALPALA